MMIKRFNEFINEELDGGAGGASTTSSPGSGTAVGSGDSGSFTSAMGVSVYGGDSGSAFATNSSVSGMGPIVSPQPSSIPGDVRGSTKGSGDIGSAAGTYTKSSVDRNKKKKKKKTSKRNDTAKKIDSLYVTNYSQSDTGKGKVIQNWKTFKESYDFSELELIGVDLQKKGNFNQDLTDIYVKKDDKIMYKIGQIRKLTTLVIFYPEFRSIENKRLIEFNIDTLSDIRELTNDEKIIITTQLKRDKKFGGLMDEPITYYDIIKNLVN
jgi:hypothetical protein